MDFNIDHTCDGHKISAACPDTLIKVVRGGYGLIIHDGGSSVVEIGFCPWCGATLPKIGDLSNVSNWLVLTMKVNERIFQLTHDLVGGTLCK
jgi:hypothetical protein